MVSKVLKVREAFVVLIMSMLVITAGAVFANGVFAEEDGTTHGQDILFRDYQGAISLVDDGPDAKTHRITYTVVPEDAEDKEILWSSSDESVATVDENGVVTAVDEGDVDITAKLKHTGKERTFPIAVRNEHIEDPVDNPSPVTDVFNLTLGEYDQVQITTKPVPARVDEYDYDPHDNSVVTVSDKGVIKAVGVGQTTVTVTTTTYPKDGSGNPAIFSTHVTVNVFEDKDTPILNITKQPEDKTVDYPDGAEFSVKVDHPENVKEYQWEERVYSIDDSDSFTIFRPDGSTASDFRRPKTDTFTLTVPSTEYNMHPSYFRCVIVDVYGINHISDEAVMTINSKVRKPVLYVGEYAVEPGETLNLEDTDLGSGTITYDPNGLDMTFDNVDIDNSHPVFDSSNSAAMGLFLYAIDDSKTLDERLEYRMYFKGDCRINNTFFDKKQNTGGVTINSFFNTGDEEYQPTLVIDGDGVLTVIGGQKSLYVHDGNIEIATDIRTLPLGSNYNHAIQAYNITIDPGVKADINCCGPALHARNGDIRIFENVELSIDATVPHISEGWATMSFINSAGSIYCKGSKLTIKGTGIPENIIPYNSSISMLAAISQQGTLDLDDTDVDIDLSIKKWPEEYAHTFYGVSGGDFSRISMTNGSQMNINIDGEDVIGTCGISLGSNLMVDPDCAIKMMISSAQRVTGIITDGKVSVHDAVVDINLTTNSKEEEVRSRTRGIDCREAEIDLSGGKGYVLSRADSDGVAIVAGGFDVVDDPLGYQKGYVPEYIKRDSLAKITLPKSGEVSSYSYKLEEKNRKAETVYDLTDTSKPANAVCFGEQIKKKDNTLTVKRNSKTIKIKHAKLEKKKQTISRKKIMTVSKAKGTTSYSLSSVSKKKFKKYFTINKKNGKVTVKKGLKKGKYKLTIKVTASGNDEYKKKNVKVTTTVKVY